VHENAIHLTGIPLLQHFKVIPLFAYVRYVLEGEIAAGHDDFDAAISKFEAAVVIEAEIPYDEPPKWFYPVRQKLGAVLLDAGKAGEAESV
jgi:hypothetical protein